MTTYPITHEVDNVDRCGTRPSAKRSSGQSASLRARFRDPAGSNKVGPIAEIPDLDAFQKFIQSDCAAAAMQHDGVRAQTLLVPAAA